MITDSDGYRSKTMMQMNDTTRKTAGAAGRMRFVAAFVLGIVLCGAAEGARIELRGEAELSGGEVRLGDIADIEGAGGEALSGVVVGVFDADKGAGRIGRDEVKRALDDAGVNWGLHMLGGTVAVELRRPVEVVERVAERSGSGEYTFARANLYGEISINEAGGDRRTVREVLVDYVLSDLGVEGSDDVEIEFEPSNILGRRVGGDRYEIRPMTTDLYGRVPVRLTRYRGGEPIDDDRVVMNVRVRKMVAVIARPVGRGQLITSGDVEMREEWLDRDADYFGGKEGLVGHRAGGSMREGRVLDTGDVRPPTVVNRREMIRVRCLSGGFVLTMTCRAMDEGAVGEVITVRNERAREEFSARVTGPGAAVMVGIGDVVASSEEVRR